VIVEPLASTSFISNVYSLFVTLRLTASSSFSKLMPVDLEARLYLGIRAHMKNGAADIPTFSPDFPKHPRTGEKWNYKHARL
jgi:hypothetical protein